MSKDASSSTLFVWRRAEEPGWLDLGPEGVGPTHCPACSTELCRAARDEWDDDYARTPVTLDCLLCGWTIDYLVEGSFVNPYSPLISYSINAATLLREFPLSSTELGFDELGAFLRAHPQALYDLNWRRFEALVADVYRQHGFRTVLTQASRDGGADVVVLHNDGRSASVIVECKCFANDRSVDVSLVRTLVGAAVMWDVRKAVLVTTSGFTRDARISAHDYKSRGVEVDLVAASDVLRLLGVYNPKLTPLASLTEEEKGYIVNQNRQAV